MVILVELAYPVKMDTREFREVLEKREFAPNIVLQMEESFSKTEFAARYPNEFFSIENEKIYWI